MTLQIRLTGLIIMSVCFCISKSLEYSQKNISCSDIQTGERFKFKHECPNGSEMSVTRNKTKIAHYVVGSLTGNHLDEVISMDSSLVVTRKCLDLQIKCIVHTGIIPGQRFVNEICVDYKIIENNPDPGDPPALLGSTISVPVSTPVGVPVGVSVGVPVGVVVLCMILGATCYICWKRYLQTYSCCRNEIPLEERGQAPKTGHPEGRGVQEVRAGDSDQAQHNGVIRLSEICAAGDRGENHIEQNGTLRSVLVHRSDPQTDGKTPPSFSLDRVLTDEGIQPTENGDASPPDLNKATNRRAMNGSLRDDPGGVNDNKGKGNVRIREARSGQALGDRGPEDDGNDEDRPLMSDQRAASQGFDMTGGAVALVDKHGFDPDPVSRCSPAPDSGVESTANTKNCCIHAVY